MSHPGYKVGEARFVTCSV